jgi:hypothetical protein
MLRSTKNVCGFYLGRFFLQRGWLKCNSQRQSNDILTNFAPCANGDPARNHFVPCANSEIYQREITGPRKNRGAIVIHKGIRENSETVPVAEKSSRRGADRDASRIQLKRATTQ